MNESWIRVKGYGLWVKGYGLRVKGYGLKAKTITKR